MSLCPGCAVSPAAAWTTGAAEKFDAQEVVRQALINLNARESLPANYSYVENLKVDLPGREDLSGADTYEVIEIKGHAFRRHTIHNGQKVAAEENHLDDEAYAAKWLEVDRKLLAEQINPAHTKESLAAAAKKIMEEAGLTDWKPQLYEPPAGGSMGVVVFGQTLYQFKLPLHDLGQKFHLKAQGEKVLDGRRVYVVHADPRRTKDEDDPAGNFKIKLWIDQQEMQIVKVEGRAVRSGLLSRADYAAFSSKVMSAKDIEEQKQQLADARLYYSEDTTITQEWTKVNDEAWLLRRRHVKGDHVLVVHSQERLNRSSYYPVEYDTVDSNYRKFRVEHRILPASSRP
jgi:hypothetical protein